VKTSISFKTNFALKRKFYFLFFHKFPAFICDTVHLIPEKRERFPLNHCNFV